MTCESSFVAKGFVILASEVFSYDKRSKKKTPQPTNNGAKGKLSHYKSPPEKKRYTKAERARIAATRAVLEILDKQEKLYE
jgi:hypothetical protein